MTEMIALLIDNQMVEVPPGTMVLEAARKLGISIPTLCHYEGVAPTGGCRLCLVEVTSGNRTQLTTACTYPVADGLIVQTETKDVREGRRLVMDLLLSRCPEVPALQEMARQLGVLEPTFSRGQNDCILCGKCVRVCHELQGVGAIGMVGRGAKREVVTPFGERSSICRTCGACEFICPTGHFTNIGLISGKTPKPKMDEFNAGLSKRGTIFRLYPQAVPNTPAIEAGNCIQLLTGDCGVCAKTCPAEAIDYKQQAREVSLDVGSIILTAGFDETDATPYLSYGLGVFPNVVTSIQFERILSASGPFGGVITRPGDGRHPKRIAFLQCVGSRDKGHPFCSSVCCMYATKEAVIAREHSKEVETTIFYMDIRSFGKDFDRYVERAKAEYGVRFVRSRVAGLTQLMDGSLSLKYETEDGELVEEAFDLVVLSVGLDAPCDADHLAAVAGLRQDPYRFLEGGVFDPTATSRAGVFVAGALGGPKDIPESVTEGSAAAQQAAAIIADARGSEIQVKVLPPETDVRGEKPRVGVFVCHCGLNIGGFVDVKAVTDYTATLPYVVFSDSNLYTCSSDTQSRIKEKIAEHNLNRVVVASCTPRTHEPLFQETIREAGLNRFLFEMANIRDQNSWVHQNDRAGATEKAIDLVKAAVSKAADLTPLSVQLLPITRRGLVIGGGITGMTAALALADQGFETVLVEREPDLGGNARFIHWMVEGQSVDAFLADLISKVRGHSRLRTKTGVRIETIEGYVGSYKTTLSDGEEIEHGVVVVATGAVETPTTAYLYGQHPQVITQRELEERLFTGEIGRPKSAVFIQCVESRDETHPYCSRICCQEAIKNSIRLKEGSPQTEVYVLYRDMRAYGMRELSYQRARELGVIFLPYDPERKPEVTANGRLTVRAHDRVLHRDLIFHPDLLVLSTGISPQADNETLAKLLKVPLTQDRFFLEAHVKLRPVEFATDGVFLAGMAHSPRSIEESIVQAQAAAGRAAVILAKEGIEAGGKVATVIERNCAGCGVCESVCAYSAVQVVEKKVLGQMKRVAEVNTTLCKGCGACSGGCRSNAIDLEGFTNEQIVDAVEALLQPI